MTCTIFNCPKDAQYPFACCSKEHGYTLRWYLAAIEEHDEEKKTGSVVVKGDKYVPMKILYEGDELAHYRAFLKDNPTTLNKQKV